MGFTMIFIIFLNIIFNLVFVLYFGCGLIKLVLIKYKLKIERYLQNKWKKWYEKTNLKNMNFTGFDHINISMMKLFFQINK